MQSIQLTLSSFRGIWSAVVPQVRHTDATLSVLQEVNHTHNLDFARQSSKQQISLCVLVGLTRQVFDRRLLHVRLVQRYINNWKILFVAPIHVIVVGLFMC